MSDLDLAGVDLVALIRRDIPLAPVARTRGGEWHGACFLCGGHDRFYVQAGGNGAKGMWRCRACQEGGDAISYLRKRHGLSYGEALRQLGLPETYAGAAAAEAAEPEPVDPPTEAWQRAALAWVQDCAADLWEDVGAKALAWLRARGLSDETIRTAQLGYNATDQYVDPAWLGLEREEAIYLPRGIVIPWFVGGQLWKVNVRRPVGKSKYLPLPGGCGNCVYGIDAVGAGLPAILVEGEFNALAIAQEAGDLIVPVALGAATHGRRVRWQAALAHAAPLLVALDNDDDQRKGEQAARYWVDFFPGRALRWKPLVKDPNQMLVDGLSLRAWVEAGITEGQALLRGATPPAPAWGDDGPTPQDLGIDVANYVDGSGAVDHEALAADVRTAQLAAAVGLPLGDQDAPLPRWAAVLLDTRARVRQEHTLDRLEAALDAPRTGDEDADTVLLDGKAVTRHWHDAQIVAVEISTTVGGRTTRVRTTEERPAQGLKLKSADLAEAVFKWEIGGSLGLGLVRARLGCDYGALLEAVWAEQARRATEETEVAA